MLSFTAQYASYCFVSSASFNSSNTGYMHQSDVKTSMSIGRIETEDCTNFSVNQLHECHSNVMQKLWNSAGDKQGNVERKSKGTNNSLFDRKENHLGRSHICKHRPSNECKSLQDEDDVCVLQSKVPNYVEEYASLLRYYGNGKEHSKGWILHAQLCVWGYDTFIGNCIIEMYSNCGSTEDAQATFDAMDSPNIYSWNILMNAYAKKGLLTHAEAIFRRIPNPNSYSWNALLKAYCFNGDLEKAYEILRNNGSEDVVSWTTVMTALNNHGYSKHSLSLYNEIKSHNVIPNEVTFVCVLDACADEEELLTGQSIHANIIEVNSERHIEVGNALIDMYSKCGSLEDAKITFRKMSHHDVITHNTMLKAFINGGNNREALDFFRNLEFKGAFVDSVTYIFGLNVCADNREFELGKDIHSNVVCIGYEQNVSICSALIDMYGNCGNTDSALYVFDTINVRDVASWNSMIMALSHNDQGSRALQMFQQMSLDGFTPNKISFVCACHVCSVLNKLEEGYNLHASIIEMGYDEDLAIGNALLNAYGKCGNMIDARCLFNKMQHVDILTWNALISGFVQNGFGHEALKVFYFMQHKGISVDSVTYLSCLSACAMVGDLETGQMIHRKIRHTCRINDTMIQNSLVHMYGKCGSLLNAKKIFHEIQQRDVSLWNTMFCALSHNRNDKEVIQLFHSMLLEDVLPDDISFVCALDACANLATLDDGKRIHSAVTMGGLEDGLMLENSLMQFYVKCRALHEADVIFRKTERSNCLSWNVIIAALSEKGYNEEALDYFYEMKGKEVMPDAVTYTCILTACARMADLKEGYWVHACIVNEGIEQDTIVANALVSMYGKCGSIDDVCTMFNRMSLRDVISWNALMSAYAQNGLGEAIISIFFQMQLQGVKPDEITFVCILMACTHTGHIDRARQFFLLMERDFNIPWTHIHHSHMIDLLCRAGHSDEAEKLIKNLPSKVARSAWLHVLGACGTHGDLSRARRIAGWCIEMDGKLAGPYVILSNIYASVVECDDGTVYDRKYLERSVLKDKLNDGILHKIQHIEVCKLNEELQFLT